MKPAYVIDLLVILTFIGWGIIEYRALRSRWPREGHGKTYFMSSERENQ